MTGGNDLVQIQDDDFEDDFLEEEENWDMRCGQFMHGGELYCQNIGSEECDFDCPFRGELEGEEDGLEEDDEEVAAPPAAPRGEK